MEYDEKTRNHVDPASAAVAKQSLASQTTDFFTPTSGTVGTNVTIRGSDFVRGDTVTFGGIAANNVDYTGVPSVVVATVPPKVKSGKIQVGLFSSAADFTVVPTVVDFNPKRAGAGATVVIRGTGFNDTPVTVLFSDNVAGQVTGGSETEIGVTVPDLAQDGPIKVILGGGGSGLIANFDKLPQPPQIKNRDGFSPKSGPPGTTVRIVARSGTQFEEIDRVLFKGPGVPKRIPAQFSIVNRKTEILAVVPQGAVTGTIRVKNAAGADATSEDFVVTGGA